MEEFLHADQFPPKEQEITKNVDNFISAFNRLITQNSLGGKQDRISLNTGLDSVPTLNPNELKLAQKLAIKNGWIIHVAEDNYNTISYTLNPL